MIRCEASDIADSRITSSMSNDGEHTCAFCLVPPANGVNWRTQGLATTREVPGLRAVPYAKIGKVEVMFQNEYLPRWLGLFVIGSCRTGIVIVICRWSGYGGGASVNNAHDRYASRSGNCWAGEVAHWAYRPVSSSSVTQQSEPPPPSSLRT